MLRELLLCKSATATERNLAGRVLASQGSGGSQPQFRPMEMSGWAADSLSLPGGQQLILGIVWALFIRDV